MSAQALSRAAQAAVRLARDDHAGAERLIREAVQVVPHDMLNLRADLHVDLAEILLAGARRESAPPVIGEAIGLYQRKGNLAGRCPAGPHAWHVGRSPLRATLLDLRQRDTPRRAARRLRGGSQVAGHVEGLAQRLVTLHRVAHRAGAQSLPLALRHNDRPCQRRSPQAWCACPR